MADLLIELFSEEIPARMQARAAQDLKRIVTDGLVEAGLTYSGAAAFSTPRRLTLAVSDIPDASPATREERKGPREDAPDKAVEGFLRSTGLTRDQLEVRDTGKGKAYFAVIEKQGQQAAEIVAAVLEPAIRNFPWPKSMRWGTGSLKWVRPLHSILCILSREDATQIVPIEIDGIVSDDTTYGHRFMAPDGFSVTSFDDYQTSLKRAFVVLEATERQEIIWNDATNMAFAQGLEVVADAGLLAEVAGLVEWPVVLMGDIGEDFLDLPPEVLKTSMREHQKFFSARNPKTGRIEKFITVANRETADNGATILAGNRKVLAARLSDAKFFWNNDLRVAHEDLNTWLDKLSSVTFHAKLGTQSQRIDRMVALAGDIAPLVDADREQAAQAARIAKADLASEMVYEFPELQGVMGRYYINAADHPAEIAAVAEEHWRPLGPTDAVPDQPLSIAVALADKFDTLTGFWAIDEKPTGSKDPFALRRAALGVIRIVLENDLRLRLDQFFDTGLLQHKIALNGEHASDADIETLKEILNEIGKHGVFGAAYNAIKNREDIDLDDDSLVGNVAGQVPDKSADLLAFFHDRLKVFLRDKGIRHDVIDACVAMPGNDDFTLLVKRAEALQDFLGSDDGINLVQGFKRANNILTQAEKADGVEYSYGADKKFAEGAEETALFDGLESASQAIAAAEANEDFGAAMAAIAGLRAPIDVFFEAVQVNSENAVVRRNRLNLLGMIRETCDRVADLSRLEG